MSVWSSVVCSSYLVAPLGRVPLRVRAKSLESLLAIRVRRRVAQIVGLRGPVAVLVEGSRDPATELVDLSDHVAVTVVLHHLLGAITVLQQLRVRSDERRVGTECVSTCRSRWSQYHKKKQKE